MAPQPEHPSTVVGREQEQSRPRYDGFAWTLSQLHLPDGPRIIDVGAGGFVGQTTTRHLVEIPRAEVTAVEISAERAQRLAEAFGDRVNVICGDFATVELQGSYDLVVIDTDVLVMPTAFQNWLNGRVFRLLRPGGYVIAINLSSWTNATAPGAAIHYGVDDRRRLQIGDFMHDFMLSYWGALEVTPEVVRGKFAADSGYEFVAVKDKWPKKNIISYVCLRKRKWHSRLRQQLLDR
jgi:predicted O-methyltransferase YrrM